MGKNKIPIIIVSVIVVAIVAFFAINSYYKNLAGRAAATASNTCYFASADKVCAVTITDLAAARDLTSLKTPGGCTLGVDICRKTLDVNGDGVVTISDVSIINDLVPLKQVPYIPGAPGKITITGAPSLLKNLTSFQIVLNVTNKLGNPSVMMGVTVGQETKFTDINGMVSFTIVPDKMPYTISAFIPADSRKSISRVRANVTITGNST